MKYISEPLAQGFAGSDCASSASKPSIDHRTTPTAIAYELH
ncbi:MAG TPA: hypothetical protein VGL53_03400 [Bryobacteraceae bacterium]